MPATDSRGNRRKPALDRAVEGERFTKRWKLIPTDDGPAPVLTVFQAVSIGTGEVANTSLTASEADHYCNVWNRNQEYWSDCLRVVRREYVPADGSVPTNGKAGA